MAAGQVLQRGPEGGKVNAAGIVMILAGVWLLAQILRGDLLGRIGVL